MWSLVSNSLQMWRQHAPRKLSRSDEKLLHSGLAQHLAGSREGWFDPKEGQKFVKEVTKNAVDCQLTWPTCLVLLGTNRCCVAPTGEALCSSVFLSDVGGLLELLSPAFLSSKKSSLGVLHIIPAKMDSSELYHTYCFSSHHDVCGSTTGYNRGFNQSTT